MTAPWFHPQPRRALPVSTAEDGMIRHNADCNLAQQGSIRLLLAIQDSHPGILAVLHKRRIAA